MKLGAGKEMDRKCVWDWLNEVYVAPSLSYCKHTDEEIRMFAYDALVLLNEQQELVRCKDCRHCTFSNGEQLADCMIKQGWFPVKPDWFCADGECKEGK